MNKNTYVSLLLVMLAITPANATAIITEVEATPSVISEPDARLLITEVNLKNSTADWVELYYESPSGKTLNLKGVSFQDDSAFKKMDQDFLVRSGQYLLLTFKSTQPDSTPYLYTARTGLTGTTEQFIIRDSNNKVIDAVCWASSAPTESEIAEMVKLHDDGGWESADAASCFPSESIGTDQSIIRKNLADSQSSTDWEIATETTAAGSNEPPAPPEPPPAPAPEPETAPAPDSAGETQITVETVADADAENEEPTLTAETGPIQQPVKPVTATKTPTATSSSAAKPKSTKKTSTSKTTKPQYANGDESSEIKISEVMPNPKEEDTKNEWVELINIGEENINLGNWQLDDDEKGSKPYILSDETVIEPGATIIVSIQDSKISLANKADKVRLFNFHGELMDEISYDEAPEEQSYALLQITTQDGEQSQKWEWTKEISPNEPNPIYSEINGKISEAADFESTPYNFKMADDKGNPINITFTEAEIAAPLAKATFLKDARIKIIAKLTEISTFALKNFEIITPGKQQEDNGFVFPSILGTLFTAGGSAFYFVRKKMKG